MPQLRRRRARNSTTDAPASINAKLVGSDPSTDLAVLKVSAPARALTPLPLGNSDRVEVGAVPMSPQIGNHAHAVFSVKGGDNSPPVDFTLSPA